MPTHKLLQYRQTEQRFVFSNDHVFRSNKTVVKPSSKNLIIMYNTVQIVLLVWIENDYVCVKLYTNRLICNVLASDCVQIVC